VITFKICHKLTANAEAVFITFHSKTILVNGLFEIVKLGAIEIAKTLSTSTIKYCMTFH
jgi:hypothetical protein